MFLFEMAFTSALITSFSKPPIWDERKTCTWGPQGWLRRCLSSVTLEQRSKAIYLYLYALSLYSIYTSVSLGSDVSSSSSFEKLSVFAENKREGGGRSRYHSVRALWLCLSLDLLFHILLLLHSRLLLPWKTLFSCCSVSWSVFVHPVIQLPDRLSSRPALSVAFYSATIRSLSGQSPPPFSCCSANRRHSAVVSHWLSGQSPLFGHFSANCRGHHLGAVSHSLANGRHCLAAVWPLLFVRCSAAPIRLLLGRSSANNSWMSLSSDCRTIWPDLSSDEALRLWHPPLELQHLNQYSQLQLHAEAAFSLD